ncbi:hypothetical protein ACWCPI_37600 [Streptomyces sp. NPDC001920]
MSDQRNLETAWRRLTDWLGANAPVSHASLLPPAPEQAIEAADDQLRQRLGFGLPAELDVRRPGAAASSRHGQHRLPSRAPS